MIDRSRRPDADLVDIDPLVAGGAGHRTPALPRTLSGWLTTTDHKAIGVAYAVTSLVFLAIGGALAGVIRAELARARAAVRSTSRRTTACSRSTAA